MRITTILDQIDLGNLVLPEFQRGYVWNRDQVRRLMTSLYRGHPIGTLMVWKTTGKKAWLRGEPAHDDQTVTLLLDGQQRITTLYGIVRGKAPPFFEGNSKTFIGLYFNLKDEVFEFYAPMRMRGNPDWISVTELMQVGAGVFFDRLVADPAYQGKTQGIMGRLNKIDQIKERDLYIDENIGAQQPLETVVEIFNNVNSGGTKLSLGDLTLAKVCVTWPEARQEMNRQLARWQSAGFTFSLDWLLRMMNVLIIGQAFFTALRDTSDESLHDGLRSSETLANLLLNHISSRLGLDHGRVLRSPFALPVMARYLDLHGGHFADAHEADRMLFWYIQTFLWGRYAGSTETVLSQDLRVVNQDGETLDALIDQVRQMRPDLAVVPSDFIGSTINARFYPLLYMLTRVCQSRDLASGIVLNAHLLGRQNRLEVHHIFPKAMLYKAGYPKSEVNALANFTFLTRETNNTISDQAPEDYLPQYEQQHPGVLATHWIPSDPALWNVQHYRDFLAARRELLAQATNGFLNILLHGPTPTEAVAPAIMDQAPEEMPVILGVAEDEPELSAFQQWMHEQELPVGDTYVELLDPENAAVIGTFDLAWPNGMQTGLSTPVALILDGERELIAAANKTGYRLFTDTGALKRYVEREVIGGVIAVGVGGV